MNFNSNSYNVATYKYQYSRLLSRHLNERDNRYIVPLDFQFGHDKGRMGSSSQPIK